MQLSALSDLMLETMLASYSSTLFSVVFTYCFHSSGFYDVEASRTGYALHL